MALSLVLKLIIAGLHVPMAFASGEATGASTSAPGLTQLIICTPGGVKKLVLDEDGAPSDGPVMPQAALDCGLCSVLQAGLATLASDAADVALPDLIAYAVSPVPHAACTPGAPELARGHDPPKA